jgi:hypothetical protein
MGHLCLVPSAHFAEPDARQKEGGNGERHSVRDQDGLGAARKHEPCSDHRARDKADVHKRAVEGGRGRQPDWRDETRKRGEARRLKQSRSHAGKECKTDGDGEIVEEHETREGSHADDIGGDHTASSRPAIRHGPEDRPQEHPGDDVGEEDEADRPRRIEALECENQERHQRGSCTQSGLAER